MSTNEYFPAMSRDGIRTLAFPLIQTVSRFRFNDGDVRPGFWTETYFTTDPQVLPAIAKMAAIRPDNIIAEAEAHVSQRRAVRVYGWDRNDSVPVDHSGWLVRLEGKALSTEKDLKRETTLLDEKIGLVNTAVSLVQGDVRELQIRAITRDDLKEVKKELTETINAVGDRVGDEVDRLVAVISKKPAAPRSRTTTKP